MELQLDTLTALVDGQDKDTFYYKDHQHPEGGDSYRIFNYRLASFQDFKSVEMLKWCRGTMFNLRTGQVVSRPMEKFFNYHEWVNNSTELPESDYWHQAIKHDGSLVSTYVHSDGQIYLKSKGSLESFQAERATVLYRALMEKELPIHGKTLDELKEQLEGMTINYEYVGMDNIIVVPYATEDILALNMIDNQTGHYIAEPDYAGSVHSVILDEWVETVYEDDETLHEGYVMVSDCGQHRFKLKTNRYLAAHRVKDDINSTKKLVALVLSGSIDDLLDCRDLGADAEFQAKLIAKSEFIKNKINLLTSQFEQFYDVHKEKDRKSYAITAQRYHMPMGIVMNLYLGKEPEIEKYFMKNLEMFEDETIDE